MGLAVRVRQCVRCSNDFEYRRAGRAPSYCNDCRRDYESQWREERRSTDPLMNIRKNAWEKHGMYAEEVVAWEVELGSCPLCGVDFDRSSRGAMPCIDHDHSCCPPARSCHKCRRGLICFNCNTVLGKVRDDVATLRRMINYLSAEEAT